jgi:hypothetical protein
MSIHMYGCFGYAVGQGHLVELGCPGSARCLELAQGKTVRAHRGGQMHPRLT